MHTIAVTIPRRRMAEFCHRWKVEELAFFGSVLREDFGAASDVDVLVTFADHASWSLLDHIQMERELESLLERPVDLITRRAVEHSHNWMRRRQIFSSAQVVFSVPEAAYVPG